MGWATGAWAPNAWAGTAWAQQSALVQVPDVVGETQAAATSTLEGDGFVVAVETAFSSSVVEGLVISQQPPAGSFANSGSTVTITISLGPAPDSKGAGRKKRRRFVVEIDKQTFEVSTIAEAEQLLLRAKELAAQHAENAVERASKRVKRGKSVEIPSPVISTPSAPLKPLVSQYRADIEAIYKQIAVDADIRELLRLKLREEDEEDAIISLLLH